MRSVALPIVAAAAVLLTACHAYKPVTLPGPGSVVGKEVRVQFSTPRNLTAARDARGDTVLRSVGAVQGRAIAVSGDTLYVALTRITDGTGEHSAPAAIRVGVLPDPSVAVDAREFDEGRTAALAGGTLIAVSIVVVAAAVAAVAAVY
jgi:hypothetical protein